MSETEKPTVAFLGPKASYTHQATLTNFPESKYTLQPSTTISDVFAAVKTHTAEFGVVPFENSSNGSVIFTLDLLKNLPSSMRVIGEVYLPVHHCLLSHTSASTQSDIKKIYSHPQAWGQCTHFLRTQHPQTERLDVSSTSKAASLVSSSSSAEGAAAAIASPLAASLYPNLQILAPNISDHENNSTRFFVLGKTTPPPPPPSNSSSDDDWKTLVSFTVPHDKAGALADSLAVFGKHGLNLTSINSRPTGLESWQYVFFVEFMGRRLGEGEGGSVNEALEELGSVAERWRWLGSWENQLGK